MSCRPNIPLPQRKLELQVERLEETQVELVAALKNARDNLDRDCDPQRTIMQINAVLAKVGA